MYELIAKRTENKRIITWMFFLARFRKLFLLESHEYNVIVVGKKRAKSFHSIGFNKKLFTTGHCRLDE
jgi:hypothetical protein